MVQKWWRINFWYLRRNKQGTRIKLQLVVIVCPATHSQLNETKQKKANLSQASFLDEAVKIINFIKHLPLSTIFKYYV